MRQTERPGVGETALTWAMTGVPPRRVEVAPDLPAMAANHLAAVTAKATGATSAMVQLLDRGTLRLLGGYQLPAGWAGMRGVPMSATLFGHIFRTGCPLLLENIETDPRTPPDAPIRDLAMLAYAGFPIRNSAGDVVGVCCVLDKQPRAWTAEELAAIDHAAQACGAFVAEQEARLAADRDRRFLDAVVESLRSAVLGCDETGQIVLANPAMRELSPTPVEEFRVYHPASAIGRHHPDGRPMTAHELPLARALSGERVRQIEVLMRAPDRPDRLVLVDGQQVTDAQGCPLGAVIAFTDVTERRRAERLRDCELRVATVLAGASRVEDAARSVVAAAGSTLGWLHAELWFTDQLACVLRPAANWTAPGQRPVPVPEELPFGAGLAGRACAEGKPRWTTDVGQSDSPISGETVRAAGLRSALAVPLRSGPHPLGVLTVFWDTAQEPEEALVTLLSSVGAQIGQFIERRRAEELALQLAQSKDEYLALVGHELRTPLTSIGAYAALLEEADPQTFAAEGPEMVRVIGRNAAALRDIVDDLLDLAELDTGHASIQREPVDLADLVRQAVADAAPAIAGAGLSASVDVPEKLLITGDSKRLRQVVDSLLGNAIKYTASGGRIGLAVWAVGSSVAELTVSDTGIGIPAEERDRLFDRFYRSSRSRDRSIPGSGLSLAISRAIVGRHGGSIVLVPGQGPGTRIAVRLPMEPI